MSVSVIDVDVQITCGICLVKAIAQCHATGWRHAEMTARNIDGMVGDRLADTVGRAIAHTEMRAIEMVQQHRAAGDNPPEPTTPTPPPPQPRSEPVLVKPAPTPEPKPQAPESQDLSDVLTAIAYQMERTGYTWDHPRVRQFLDRLGVTRCTATPQQLTVLATKLEKEPSRESA